MVLQNHYDLITKFKQEQHLKNFCSQIVIFVPLKNKNKKELDHSSLSKAKEKVLRFWYCKITIDDFAQI